MPHVVPRRVDAELTDRERQDFERRKAEAATLATKKSPSTLSARSQRIGGA